MDRQYDRRPQGSTWSPVTPSTPTFNPSKFTPAAQQTAWKPFQMSAPKGNDEAEVIQGSVKVDPSGGYVHTFGAPKRESTPQSSISNASDTSSWQNSRSPHQEPMIITSAPRCVQEIIIPTNDTSNQFRSPVRQTSYQSNASQFSPVQQSPQRSPASPVYYQVQNNGFDNAPNGNSAVIFHTPRQVSSPYQINRQESVPYQASRQDSVPYQQTRQEPVTYQVNRQDSVPYQAERQNSNLYQQNSYSSPMVRQESTSYPPSRQDSWNQPIHQETRQYSPSRQQSWSNQPVQQNSSVPFNRQESLSNKPVPVNSSFPTNRQDSWSNDPNRQNSVPYQSPGLQPVRGLFVNQNSIPSSNTEQIEQYEPVVSNSTPACQRQSSIQQYQSSPKPYSPTNRSPIGGQQPEFSASNNASSPYTYGVPGPFARQQSSGPQSWSSGPAEAFPTPPPFSPATESAGAPWPSSSELPTPPPPPPPSFSQPNPGPVAMPPPPPPPPPPPMPSSAGVPQEVPAWKKQIKATKEAKAAAGIVPQTPGTPSGPEMPAALANSMKKDKKPFTYLPGGLDLSEIRSPKMQRRLIANQQYAPPPPSCTGQQVLLQPRGNATPNQAQQLPNQLERLNLGEEQSGMTTAVEPQRRPSADGQDPRNYGQSRSFRLLQMMTGGDDETDSAPVQPSVARKEEDEMRFTGLRRPDHPIPSRAFQALQKMTSGNEDTPNTTADPRYNQDSTQEQDDTPVDIRYKGGYIPGRSFKMLQEMTGMNEDGTPTGTVVPSVLQEKRQQRKAPPHLHLNINQPPPPKQFPQPSVPASQQATDDAPKMYTGGRIPSQSFRILQAMTGDNPQNTGEDGTDM